MPEFRKIDIVKEILNAKGPDDLAPEKICEVTEELKAVELKEGQREEVQELGPAVDRLLKRLKKKSNVEVQKREALLKVLEDLRGILNAKRLQPEVELVSSQFKEGMLKEGVKGVENFAYKTGKQAEQFIKENPKGILIAGTAFGLGAVMLYGKKVARGIWQIVTYPFRLAWKHKGKVLLGAAALAGIASFFGGKKETVAGEKKE